MFIFHISYFTFHIYFVARREIPDAAYLSYGLEILWGTECDIFGYSKRVAGIFSPDECSLKPLKGFFSRLMYFSDAVVVFCDTRRMPLMIAVGVMGLARSLFPAMVP